MLLQIHPNSFLSFAFAFPHKIEACCLVGKCGLTFTNVPPLMCELGVRNGKRRTLFRRSSNWRCRSGMGEPLSLSEWELQEGRMAVSAFLQELGVSEEESQSIASNSPAYMNMLVEGARDLEQLSSSSVSTWDGSGFNFRDKLLHIAAQKGDNGKLAYLESLGFTLSSSMNVARYISTDTLPSLIHKVTSIKQLFFPPHDSEFLIKNIRRMMRHLSISIDEDLQHTFSFFEKIEARRGGLNLFASKDVAFRYLIESFPRILLLSVNNHMARVVDFLENIGIPRERISNIILAFPPILLWNLQVLKTRALALKEVRQFYPALPSLSICANKMPVLSSLHQSYLFLKVFTSQSSKQLLSQIYHALNLQNCLFARVPFH